MHAWHPNVYHYVSYAAVRDNDLEIIADQTAHMFGPDCTADCVEFTDDIRMGEYLVTHREVMYGDQTKYCDDCEDLVVKVDHLLDSVNTIPVHSPRARMRMNKLSMEDKNMARVGKNPKSTIDATLRELQLSDDAETAKYLAELDKRAEEARKAIDESRKAGSEIAVRPDKVVSPFRNYQRPVASPKMEVATPYETETGVVMPPLPEHKCEFPEVIETVKDKWADAFSNAQTDNVLLPNNSVFSCICGKNWWVSVRPVPFHAAKYEGQHVFAWHEIRWYNFARKADLRKRKEQ